MHLISHHLKKDLREQAPLLAGWLGLLVLYVVAAGSDLSWATGRGDAQMLGGLLMTGKLLLPIILVCAVIFSDPPVDPEASWQTRPLRGGPLLAAKSLFIALTVVLPWMVALMSVVARGGSWVWVAPTIGDFFRTSFWLIPCVAALAGLAGRPRTFWLLAVSLFVAYVGCLLLVEHGLNRLGWPQEMLGLIVTTPVLVPVSILALLVLYLKRGRRVAAWVLGIGGLVSVVLFQLWLAHRPMPSAGTGQATPSFALGIKNDPVFAYDADTGSLDISAVPELRGLRAPFFAEFRDIQGQVRLRGATHDSATSGLGTLNPRSWPGHRTKDHPYTLRTYRKALQGERILNPNPGGWPTYHLPLFSFSDFDPDDDEPRQGSYSGRVHLEIYKYVPVAEFPLKIGAGWQAGPLRIAVQGFLPGEQGLTLLMRERSVRLQSEQAMTLKRTTRNGRYDPRRFRYLIVNRKRHEALAPPESGGVSRWMLYPVNHQTRHIRYSFSREGDAAAAVADPDWLEDAVVIVVSKEYVGPVVKELQIDNFRLPPDL